MSARRLLEILIGAACTITGCGYAATVGAIPTPQPTTPIHHLIVLVQQNRSFDHYFGTYPGAEGIPPGTCLPVAPPPDRAGCVEPFWLGTGTSVAFSRSETIFVRQFNDGDMDGFVYALNERHEDGAIAMGHYDGRDVPYYWNLADEYVLFDHFFSAARGGSIMNALYMIAATSVSVAQRVPTVGFGELPTVFDRLEELGVPWKFYVNRFDPTVNYRSAADSEVVPPQLQWVPLLSFDRFLDDPVLASKIVDMDEYFSDLRNGTLPAVAYMVGLGATDHPPAHPERAQRFVRKALQALMQSSAWSSSAFMVIYDDWGGWYDHVPPPIIDEDGYGFRVPALLVSPYAPQGRIDSTPRDSTSILRFIQENYGLEPFGTRDREATSLASAFDFDQPPRPPEFVPFERSDTGTRRQPRRPMIYLVYGATIVSALGVIARPMMGIVPRASSRKGART
jgi:phospholipase C